MEKSRKPKIRFKGYNDDWEQRKLGNIGQTYTGLSGKTKDDFGHGYAQFVTYMNVFSNPISNPKMNEPIEVDSKQNEVEVGDVFFTTSSETPKEVGMTSVLIEKQGEMYLNSFCFGYRLYEKYDSYYLAYMLRSNSFRKKIIMLAQGISRYNISKNKVMEIDIFIPSYKEQMEIGKYFRDLDTLITLHQRKLDKLINVKKSMLEKMFPKQGSTVPEIRFNGFTQAWEQREFDEVFVEKRDKTERENEDTLLSCAINGIYLNSELFGHFRGATTIGYLKVNKNDLILSAQNLHLGNANVNLRFEHGIISPAYKVYDLVDCDPYFVHSWVKKDSTKNFFLCATTEGASQCRKNIEWHTLEKQTILMPVIQEQNLIGNYFQALDELITLHQRKLEKLKNIKKSMLEKMFV